MTRHPVLSKPGSTVLLLGNEAIARGAIEYGIGFAAAYPGTPSSEIVATLARVAKEVGIYVEWSTNEKTSFEAAYAAAMSGVPSLTAMKHVGLNVAADPFMTSGYTGVRAGFLIVTADDPYMHSSQNEQDNRWYGLHAYIPVLEPSNPQEAKELTVAGLELSEKLQHPFILRTMTRISHTRAPVRLSEPRKPRTKGAFPREPEKWAVIPAHARKMKARLVEKWKRIEEELAKLPLNRIEGEGSTLIVAPGIGYAYAKEALGMLKGRAKVLKIASPVPLPKKLVEEAVEGVEKILVVEETDPIVEMQLKAMLHDMGVEAEVHGEDLVGRLGELTLDKVLPAVAKVLGINWSPPEPLKAEVDPPPRPPTLCPGCPHRAAYYALKEAARRLRVDPVYSGDIGCYSLGIMPPFRAQDVITDMGASIGLANGFAHVLDRPVVAIIGDSTFYHAGLPPLINAAYNGAPMLVLVLDNETTAMTGFQPHPGSGAKATGEPAKRIPIEDLARACGADIVEVFDPYDVKKAVELLEKGLREAMNGRIAVLISRRECALQARRADRLGGTYRIDPEKCVKCLKCARDLACPAIRVENGAPVIDELLCVGCGVCAQVCPVGAVVKVK